MDLFGLLSFIFVVVLTILWWGLYDAANPPGDAERDPFSSLAMSGLFVGGIAPVPLGSPPSSLDTVLQRIGTACGYGKLDDFLEGARRAYELIVVAVARGDLDDVAHLLTDEVTKDFRAYIDARHERGETETLTFIGFHGADIVAASLEDVASVDVRFSAEIASVTRDREGGIVEGSANRIVRVAEIWTFERDMNSRKPLWRLAATEADE
jgi:predicted lipid-binding transport protein (Tim44 family)